MPWAVKNGELGSGLFLNMKLEEGLFKTNISSPLDF